MSVECPNCGIISVKYMPVTAGITQEPEPGQLRIAIVGEAPGDEERLQNKPFIGESGKLLRATLKGAGINPDTCFFTNVLCCQLVGDKEPKPHEIAMGRHRMLKELLEFKPDRIVALGNTPLTALLGDSFIRDVSRITDARGCWYDCVLEGLTHVRVLPTFHPAYILRESINFVDFAADIKKINKPDVKFPVPQVFVVDSYDDALRAFNQILPQKGEPESNDGTQRYVRSVDIETTGFNAREDKILSIGIALDDQAGYIFTDDLLYSDERVCKMLQALADHPKLLWVGHNSSSFDIPFMLLQNGIKFPVHFDTMLAHYSLDERTGTHSLKTLARGFLNLPNYEKNVKKYLKAEGATFADIPRPELYLYQSYDVTTTWRLYFTFSEKLNLPSNKNVKNSFDVILMPASDMLGEVRQTGILVDVPYIKWLDYEWKIMVAEKINDLRIKTGKPTLNPNSTQQLARLIYDELKLPSPPETGTDKHGHKTSGSRSTRADWLKEIESLDDTGFVGDLLKMRKMVKILSTYVTGLLAVVHNDNRLRPNLMLHGTETGRLASRGPNIQNIPKHGIYEDNLSDEFPYGLMIRHAFTPTPGYVYVDIDYSQLEYRCACWNSRDPKLIEAFWAGTDFHKAVAANIYQKRPEDVTKAERHSAKFVNFGIMYGRRGKSLADGELRDLVLDVPAFEAAEASGNKALMKMLYMKSIDKAEQFIKEFNAVFPVNARYFEDLEKSVYERKYVESFVGRRRRFPLIMERNRNDCGRAGRNMPIQAMASDLCLMAGYEIHNNLPKDDVRVLFFVHDSIFVEVKEDMVDKYVPQIQHMMENPAIIPENDRIIPWKVEVEVLNRWAYPPDEYLDPYKEFLKNNPDWS